MLLAASALSLVAAFLLRFEFAIPASAYRFLQLGLCIFVPVRCLVFCGFRLHRITWRLVSLVDVTTIAIANLAASLLASAATIALLGPSFPRSIYVLEGALCFLATVGLLSSVRLFRELQRPNGSATDKEKSVLIYGAGEAGLVLVQETRANPKVATVVAGFLDDDAAKLNACIAGVSVLGAGRDAPRLVASFKRSRRPISEIIIAMPSATGRQMRAATANCRAAEVPFKTVPSLGELLDGKVLTRQLREVSVNDLLGRQPVNIDESKIAKTIEGRVVLITGGCGSIGSELSRQVARFNPRKLVILDQAESEMFMLALELRGRFPSLQLVEEVGDICRFARVEEVVAKHSVEAVFHAAAYKHVPLMEDNPVEAAENNILGTYNVAEAARRHGVHKFVLISTDKAVNPTSVMGATKRGAELIVSAMPIDGGSNATTFVSVRFGNVLASAGSVVQIFQRQIAAGGPVTVTHPAMRRYFMSIPEAVQLVLQASTMGRGSEVFVLDMGEPVLIVDLARNMIRLAGLVPDEDIEIRFTHQRPGEKLFEELSLDREDIVPTFHEKIKVFRSRGPEAEYLREWMETLRSLLDARNGVGVRAHLMTLVPEYTPAGVDGRMSVPLKNFVPAMAGGNSPWRITAA
jgi:FlaA1/EpsC-like NDP-sugar epimerase